MLALVERITALFEEYHGVKTGVSEQEMADFLSVCLARALADEMITPREIIRDYITVLNIIIQNDNVSFLDVVKKVIPEQSEPPKGQQEMPKRVYTTEDIEF